MSAPILTCRALTVGYDGVRLCSGIVFLLICNAKCFIKSLLAYSLFTLFLLPVKSQKYFYKSSLFQYQKKRNKAQK